MKKIKLFEAFINEDDDIKESINLIQFGNPILEHFKLINSDCAIKSWFIDNGIAQIIIDEAPSNSSDITHQDLKELETKLKSTTPEEIAFARHVDNVENYANMFLDIIKKEEPTISMGDFFRVDSQIEPILFYLKDKINRPRPYQLAKALQYNINPIIKTDASSAAYPSGHALSVYFMSQYFANKYPNLRESLLELGEKIADSRVNVGIHFPSDNKISKEIAETIIKNDLID